MDKIKALIIKCGLSEEAADSICEALEKHTQAIRESLESEYTKRTETAKKICIEETENHKLELSRRMQVFCEAKDAQINQIIMKQAQQREGQAVNTLEQVKSILEGVSISDETGLKQKVLALENNIKQLSKERDQAITKANRQTEIAEKVLKRNRLLESKMVRAENNEERQSVNENRTSLGNGRRNGTATTTRRTIAESQDRGEPIDNRTRNTKTNTMRNGLTPAQIAASIEDGPPI